MGMLSRFPPVKTGSPITFMADSTHTLPFLILA